MSPLAAGLFHRAILQSGSVLNPFWLPMTEADAVAQSTFLGDAFGCYDMSVEERLQCLRALDRCQGVVRPCQGHPPGEHELGSARDPQHTENVPPDRGDRCG